MKRTLFLPHHVGTGCLLSAPTLPRDRQSRYSHGFGTGQALGRFDG